MNKLFLKISSEWKQIDSKRRQLYRNIISIVFTPFFAFVMLQSLVPFVQTFEQMVLEIKPFSFFVLMSERFIPNYLFFLLIYGVLFFLPKYRVTSSVVTLLFFVIGMIQHHVIHYKRQLIYPNDIQNIFLLKDISSEYNVIINRHIVIGFVFLLLTIGFSCIAYTRNYTWKKRLIGSLSTILLSFLFIFGFALNPAIQRKFDIHYKNFQPVINVPMNGLVMTYFYYIAIGQLQVPENYSDAKAIEILDQYVFENDSSQGDSIIRPHVIVVVNESLADYELLYDLEINDPIMPYYHSLEGDNVVKRDLLCSVLGGGTANTEMEILTGHSMYFFPPGSYPFLQVFHHDINSIARIYSEEGYRSIYIHPYSASGWNRDKVIPYLGFDEHFFIDDFVEPELTRQYISDMEAYHFVINQFEDHIYNYPNQPLFQYLLTMQNHGGYEDENFMSTVFLSDTDQYPSAEQYLSLLQISDAALKDLIEYFESVDEPVLIIYLGDHQPVFPDLFEIYIQDYYVAEHDPLLQQYITPIMYWANFDLSSFDVFQSQASIMSSNYVIPLISDIVGVQDPYMLFLKDLFNQMPCVNARGILDAQGKYYNLDSEMIPDHIQERIVEYEILQHYFLSKKYISASK